MSGHGGEGGFVGEEERRGGRCILGFCRFVYRAVYKGHEMNGPKKSLDSRLIYPLGDPCRSSKGPDVPLVCLVESHEWRQVQEPCDQGGQCDPFKARQ